MSPIVEEIRHFLPLKVAVAEADADGVCLGGDRWRLRVNTNWRVTRNGRLVLSPSIPRDASAAHGLEDLIGDEIVDIGVQSREVGLDLAASTRAGYLFEIFSDFPYGEWIFSVWSLEDEHRIPIFDLEGPVSPDLV